MSMAWFKEWEAFVKAKTDSELLGLFHPLHLSTVSLSVGSVGVGGWEEGGF